MRRFIICLLTAMALSVPSAYAGPGGAGHSHAPVIQVTETQVLEYAPSIVDAIVKEGKLDASWTEIKPTEAKKERFEYGLEWVVVFNNPTEADQEKKTLYVFLSLDGQFLGANFTGS